MNSNDEPKLMALEISRYLFERRDKKELALLKEKPAKDKGGINTRLVGIAGRCLGKSHDPLKMLISQKKDKAQSPLEFQQSKYQGLLSLVDEYQTDSEVIDIIQEHREALQLINHEHGATVWLNLWAEKAERY